MNQFNGPVAAARARREAVLALFRREAKPLTEEDVWLRARPRMTRSQAIHALNMLRAAGKIETHTAFHQIGRKQTFQLVAQPAATEQQANA